MILVTFVLVDRVEHTCVFRPLSLIITIIYMKPISELIA